MSKNFKRIVSIALVVLMLVSACLTAIGCKKDPIDNTATYTYKSYSTALGNNWNPHTWESNADDSILSYISAPFVTMEAKDTAKGEYQWIYEMATSIKDVTKENQGDLTKYNVTLPKDAEGNDIPANQIEKDFVYEIKLNPDAKWENGVKITADDYIYSMQQLLNSKMRNYRANLYWSGSSALAGAYEYYNSEAPIYESIYGDDDNVRPGVTDTTERYVNVNDTGHFGGTTYSFKNVYNKYIKDEAYGAALKKIEDAANAYGYTKITDENKADVKTIVDGFFSLFSGGNTYEANLDYVCFFNSGVGEKVEFDKVGLYKVDDYTIRYVCKNAYEYYYFLTSCTSTWLVYKDLYEAGKDTTGELVTTNYGTSKATSMSYGVYKIADLQKDKQIIFVQNENWYGWQRNEDGTPKKDEEGNLISYTTYHKNIDGEAFKVDGKEIRQHTITKVVIDVMEEAAAKQAFLQGKLTDWAPAPTELPTYAASDRLYKVDETYTMSFFFNCGLANLKQMDEKKGNVNSVVLSNINFRKAMSLAINRAEYVTATEGYTPAFALLNKLYYYDFYNDPTSSYRNTKQAKEAILNLYGVKYGAGTPYDTIDKAVASITGYNLEEAKKLMKTACEELVEAGIYTEGEEIKIKIGWAKGALTSADQKQITLINNMINAALEGSGFGKITLEGVGNLPDRYGDVPKGEFAIGYGAWGGAALYPFTSFRIYMDPDDTDINEAGCWDPKTEELTLTINGEEVTMTWQAWSNSMADGGRYTNADFETKLTILSLLETKYLEKYYRIPLAGTTICSILSYQIDYYTQDYNFAYAFGGSRLMKFNYSDAEWDAFVAENNGKLSYE